MFKFVKNIFNPTFTWKHIELDDQLVEEIRQISLDKLKTITDNYFAQHLDLDFPFLIKGRKIVSPLLIYCPGNFKSPYCHKDPIDEIHYSSTYALNIPLINCGNSKTTFYKDRKPLFISSKYATENTRIKYDAVVEMQSIYKAKEISSYVLDRPTLLNTQVFHNVINYSSEPRFAISLRFDKNPVEWI